MSVRQNGCKVSRAEPMLVLVRFAEGGYSLVLSLGGGAVPGGLTDGD